MKNKIIITFLISTTLLLTGCCLSHDFAEATCTTPSTCTKCKKTEGEAIGHTWIDATCEQAKTCSVCNLTDGDPLEHTWLEATTEAPKTCEVCSLTEGEPLEIVEETEDEYQGDSPYDKEVSEYDGMTPEQIAQQLIADYLKDNAQTGQIHVDIPGATPYDPSQDGSNPYNPDIDMPEWAKGDFIN